MTQQALILTYHGVEPGPAPLWVGPAHFREHLDCLQESGARLLTMRELWTGMCERTLPERAVAITFDDGMLSVAEEAAPLLLERGMRATIYCVAGRVGGDNSFPHEPSHIPRRPLAGAAALRELAAAGFEIGCHGMEHLPLWGASDAELRREILEAKDVLEQLVGAPVSSFAYPYGALPGASGRMLIQSTYSTACSTVAAYARAGDDRFALPRVDIHYLRRPALLRRAAEGSLQAYIGLRRQAGRVRRYARKDYIVATSH
jgi:peptidoglycan/xylan/chitin deacetylase (PgdA/CDA1 family)